MNVWTHSTIARGAYRGGNRPWVFAITCTRRISYARRRRASGRGAGHLQPLFSNPCFRRSSLATCRSPPILGNYAVGNFPWYATENGVNIMFGSDAIGRIVGDSLWARRLRRRVLQVAAHEYNVLVGGASGTGKELVARAIHAHSSRRDKPFVPVDCASIPNGLFASQLFGHVKGAFTGASHAAMGCFRAADGGTLFLDEIGDLDPDLQAKLLRVLQEQQVVPVGGHQPVPVNVRVVAATHHDLRQDVQAGRFRLDLFYRLNVVRMETAPLKDRTEDIRCLAEHFLAKVSIDNGIPLKRISSSALARLEAHDWPGNVRELEHAIECATVFHEGTLLGADAFDDMNDRPAGRGVDDGVAARRDRFDRRSPGVVEEAGENIVTAMPDTPPAGELAAELDVGDDEHDATDYELWPSLADVERTHIHKTLKETFFNQSAAARLLQIDRKQLAHKIKKYHLRIPKRSAGRPPVKR